MIRDSSSNIENLITQLLIDNRYKQGLEIGQKKYQIRQYKINQLAPNQIFSMYYNLSTRFYYSKPDNQESWHENQLRIFIWILVNYSFFHHRCISEMTTEDWLYFSRIFNNRDPEVFHFQALSILKREVKFVKWSEEQVQLLDSIIRAKQVKNKWNQIAKDLFLRSEKRYFRTAKQCREHWINHLDPTPKRSFWKPCEDLQLVRAVQKMGKKWAKVSKILNGTRTEHMVKNRFKSLYHHQIKSYSAEELKNIKQPRIIAELELRLLSKSEVELKVEDLAESLLREEEIDEQKIQVPNSDDNLMGLILEEQPEGEDELFKFTIQTFSSFRNLYETESNLENHKDLNDGQDELNNFFDSQFTDP